MSLDVIRCPLHDRQRQGLAMGWYLYCRARCQGRLKTEDEDNNNGQFIMSRWTIAHIDLQPIVIPSASLLPNLTLAAGRLDY